MKMNLEKFMNIWSRICFAGLVLLLSCTIASAAVGKTPTEDLKPVLDELIKVLGDDSLKGADNKDTRQEKIMAVVREGFDFREMSKRVLGKTWREIGAQEQKHFTALMTEFLKNVYIGKLESYSGQTVDFAGEVIKGDRAQVSTNIDNNGVKIPVYYIMNETAAKWMVYDINIEGVSLVRNYQEQFKSILRTEKYEGLVKVLEEKNKTF